MTAVKVLRYELRDLRRSRWILGYALCLLLLTEALLRFGGGGPRAVLSLMNVVLVVVPLVSIVFGDDVPLRRRATSSSCCWRSRWAAARSSRGSTPAWPRRSPAAFVLGVGLPFLWGGAGDGSLAGPLAMLLAAGMLLTLVFTALALLVRLLFEDRAKGLGVAILVWLAATALYDAVLVLVATAFDDRSLELPLIGLTLLNPVDLGRVLLLLRLDTAALMGYTGAVFERFFGSMLRAC